MTLTLTQCLAALPGARVVGDVSEVQALRVHSDTRTLRAGDLFVALRGERFDANDYLTQARDAGAVVALAERGLAAAGLCGVEVADSRIGLGQLAQRWRAQFTLPLIAVTGSNGKTTVTQMVASILRAHAGDAAHATQGNLNNDGWKNLRGVPYTARDASAMRRAFAGAGGWARQYNLPVLVTAFAVHDTAPTADRLRWLRDLRVLAEEQQFAWTVWSWQDSAGFGVSRGGTLSGELNRALGLSR